MTPEEIRNIRNELNITQDQLATILGITKAAITRYESKSEKTYSTPQPEVEKKLLQLKTFLSNERDKEKLINLRYAEGGIASLAGIIALGSATFSMAASTFKILPFGLNILGSTAAISALGAFISSIINDNT